MIWMYITEADCFGSTDTLIFRKPAFFGVWIDRYNLGSGYEFWGRFGGNSIAFKWIKDN